MRWHVGPGDEEGEHCHGACGCRSKRCRAGWRGVLVGSESAGHVTAGGRVQRSQSACAGRSKPRGAWARAKRATEDGGPRSGPWGRVSRGPGSPARGARGQRPNEKRDLPDEGGEGVKKQDGWATGEAHEVSEGLKNIDEEVQELAVPRVEVSFAEVACRVPI